MQTMTEHEPERDEEVVKLLQAGQPEEYREIVERYETKLLRYATYLVRDEDEAADVVQNSFVKAYMNLRGFDTKKKFSSWIYRIVHNEAINAIKKKHKEISLDDNDWIKNIADGKESAEEEISRAQTMTVLRQHLQDMPVTYSEPLELFYIEEKSYEEISDILHLPMGTVGTRISRGKMALKKIYEQSRTK
jgi:RNA polymerase sigma-70 factor, ECF subfamily